MRIDQLFSILPNTLYYCYNEITSFATIFLDAKGTLKQIKTKLLVNLKSISIV